MPDHLRSNLDQFGQEGAKGPVFDASRKDQPPEKIAQVVGQNKESLPHLIRDKSLAGQPSPVQGVLAFLDPLLGHTASVVKVNHAWGLCAHIGHNETDSRIEFALMPFDLGDDPTRTVPTGGLIFEVGKPDDGLSGWTTHRPGQQVFNLLLKDIVCGKPDGIQKALLLQVFINPRLGKGGIPTKVFAEFLLLVASHDRFQQLLPAIRTVNVAGPKHGIFAISELVEAKQGMVTSASEMAVVGRGFLLAMDGTG